MRKWIAAAAVYLATISVLLLYKDDVLQGLEYAGRSWPLLLAVAVLLALFPILPYKLVIAAAAYAFGTMQGAILCWIGATTAAVLMYFYARLFVAGSSERWLSRSPRLQAFAARLERRPLLFIFVGRLIPFLPQQLINLYAAAAGIRPAPYIAGTALGKLPLMLVYAFAGEKLLDYLLGR